MDKLRKGHYTIEGWLESYERRNCSYYGNPAWDIWIDTGQHGLTRLMCFKTQSDAAVGYEVSNFKRGKRVKLTCTPAGRVYNMEEVK